jgi:hypothetical protein
LDANARLIAAAPDLLAACKAMEAAWEHPATVKDANALRAMLRAAIARAEGGAAPAPAPDAPLGKYECSRCRKMQPLGEIHACK